MKAGQLQRHGSQDGLMDDQREITTQPEDKQDVAIARSKIPPASEADPGKKKVDEKDQNKDESQNNKKSNKEDGDGKGKKNSRLPLIILAIVVVVAAIGGGIYWFLHRNQIGTDDAYTEGRAVMIAPQVNGYVVTLAVNDNQFVHKGDLLVQIDTRPYVAARDQAQAQIQAAQAQLENAKANLELAKDTFPARLRQAQAQAEQARAQQEKAQADLKRQRGIDPRATTQQDIDAAVAAARVASATTGSQQANVDINRPVPLNIELVKAQVQQAEAQAAQAQAQLEQADLNLDYTHVVAPQDGWVTRRNVETGNYLQSGTQIMALVAPEVWVTANFKESQLTRMRPGQKVEFEVDAYPGLKLRGHVDSIQLGSGSRFSAFPAENATGNFVKIVQRVPVKLVIDGGLDPNQPLPLGLSVVPTVYFE
jgi:membrane fusion protein (multidrug efflux system)